MSPVFIVWLLLLVVIAGIAGCLDSNDSPAIGRSIPLDTRPCEHPEFWPFSLPSARYPFLVHYRSPDEADTARKVIGDLEAAWDFEVRTLGFPPPPADGGECGPDESFDVFVWQGKETCFVQVIHEGLEEKYKIVTPWGGRRSYMVVDPWGKYGKAILGQTIAHEFNHASHAAEDWYDSAAAFEMTATYVEQYFNSALAYNIADFQAHPDWGLLWNDEYATYYMYGSGLYFYFLRDYYFSRQGTLDAQFPARLWHSMRNDSARPLVNKPNVVDGLDELLAPFGHSFVDSALVFARWRYYAGKNDDGRHFRPWQGLPGEFELLPFLTGAEVKLAASIVAADTGYEIDPPLMLTGNAYVEIVSDQPGRGSFELSLLPPDNPAVKWVVQAVPGMTAGSDGEVVDLSSGSARVAFAVDGRKIRRTLIISAVPATSFDPDDRSGERFPVALRIRL